MTNERYDLWIDGVDIACVDRDDAVLRDAAIGVTDGRIAWLGPRRDAAGRGDAAAARLALPGRLVVPGFVNPHIHSALVMVRGVAADLGFAPSYTRGIPNAAMLSAGEARAIAALGAAEALLAGSTLLGEHFVHMEACVEAIADLGVRLVASERLHDVDFAQVPDGRWVYDDAIGQQLLERNLALLERWHGHDRGRVTIDIAAHAPDTCSLPYLRRLGELARRHGTTVNTHLAQSTAEVDRVQAQYGLRPAQLLAEAGLLDERLLAAHCLYVQPEDIEMLARAGATCVHVPKCNAASGRLAPTRALREAGVRIALCTDTQHGDMIEVMRWALATARIQAGGVAGGWQPRDVLRMATGDGAAALGLENRIGSIEIGKQADLVVLDARAPHWIGGPDPVGTLVHCGSGRDVEHVFVAGRHVVRGGRLALVDQDALVAEARAALASVWQRARG